MPRSRVAVYTAPTDDVLTCYFVKAFRHICDASYAGEVCWFWNLVELRDELATKQFVWDTIKSIDPILFFGVGHGTEDVFTGFRGDIIFSTCNNEVLKNRIVFLISCLTGVKLGKDMVDKGAIAYLGFKKEYLVPIKVPPKCRDPMRYDEYAKPVVEPIIKALSALLSGAPIKIVRRVLIDSYNQWIKKLSESNWSAAPYIIYALTWNRDAVIAYGDLNAIATKPVIAPITIGILAFITSLLDIKATPSSFIGLIADVYRWRYRAGYGV